MLNLVKRKNVVKKYFLVVVKVSTFIKTNKIFRITLSTKLTLIELTFSTKLILIELTSLKHDKQDFLFK